MAKNRSDKSPMQSRFGAGWISGAQWLAENMCSREARANGNELPQRFWTDPYWEKKLKLQLKHANDLLKEYPLEFIVKALRQKEASTIYSLGLKSVLVPLIKREKRKIDVAQKTDIIVDTVDINETPRKPFSTKQNKLQRLRDLENG